MDRARRFTPAMALAMLLLAFAGPPAGARALDGSSNWTLGGAPCSLIEVPAQAAPVGVGSCPGVRPGAIVQSDAGQCTFNFLFTGSDGRRYIGTAGHCILGESPIGGDVGEQSWAPGTGPEAPGRARPARRGVRLRDPAGPEGLRVDPPG